MFSHEKFQAYQLSICYWESVLTLLDKIPSGNSVLKDQLIRAASSISLNIAEGCGRLEERDRKRFFAIARGSAMECAAISDLLVRREPSLLDVTEQSKEDLLSIVKILSTVILKRGRGQGRSQGSRGLRG
ncbi:MAG: four helix bundle protein [Bdellovibrionales bacterium]|nr:four helix bundle protein [Bdellovibrionales bacterium]